MELIVHFIFLISFIIILKCYFLFSSSIKGKRKRDLFHSMIKSKSKSKRRKKRDPPSSDEDEEDYSSDDEDEEDEDADSFCDDDSPMPVGGVMAKNLLLQTDEIKSHPRWVKLPATDLEAQRSEIRNHINVSTFIIS